MSETKTEQNAKLDLNLNDLDLSELQTLSEESSYALPEAGATIGWNSCSSRVALDAAE